LVTITRTIPRQAHGCVVGVREHVTYGHGRTMLQNESADKSTEEKRKLTMITIEQWMDANPGWHDVATVKAATGYAWSTVGNTLEHLTMQMKVIRDGAPHTKGGIRYHAITPYFKGYRLKS
jgi:hypothetical protein